MRCECEYLGPRGESLCIHHVPLFEGVSEEEMLLLTNAVRSRRYKKGQFVFREGDESDALYVVHKGVVKVVKWADTGREYVIRFLFDGDFGGMSSLFQEEQHYASAEIIEDASVCRIYRNDLKAIINTHHDMAYRLLAALSGRLRDADEWGGTMALMDAERRLAKILLVYTSRVTGTDAVKLPVSKRDLAGLIGMTPETLSRKLAAFESKGYISLCPNKTIQVINRAAMEAVASS